VHFLYNLYEVFEGDGGELEAATVRKSAQNSLEGVLAKRLNHANDVLLVLEHIDQLSDAVHGKEGLECFDFLQADFLARPDFSLRRQDRELGLGSDNAVFDLE